MSEQKTYLVCPLNWGLGHASRLVPVINNLLTDNHRVIIGGDSAALELLHQTFPQLQSIPIPDVKIRFSSHTNSLKIVALIPRIISSTIREHFILKSILQKHHIDVVISDNRYGLWNKNITSVFITHQLMIKLPKAFSCFEKPVHQLIKSAINKYNYCWIPDFESKEKSLSGDLSHKYPLPKNTKFIGLLSRFSNTIEESTNKTFNIVILLSGPEPSRTNLENELIKLLTNADYSVLIIQGLPLLNKKTKKNNITIISHLPTSQIKFVLNNAQLVICRPGYSTLMDLAFFNVTSLLIPTPGQTEQEYLASHLKTTYHIIYQNDIKHISISNYL